MWKRFLLLLALVLLCVGGFVYLRTIRPPSDPKSLPVSADVVPAGVALYASARISELWDSPHFATLRDTPKEGPTDALTKAFGLVEVDMSELDAATYVVHADPKLPHTIVAAGRKPFDLIAAANRLRSDVLNPEQAVPGFPRTVVYSCKREASSFAEVEGLLIHLSTGGPKNSGLSAPRRSLSP